MSLKRKLLFPLFSLVLSVVFCVLLIEGLLRVVQPQREVPRWLVPHARYGHFQRANFEQIYDYRHTNVTWRARINNLGLRGPDVDLARTDDRRILFAGDSFTFGYGLDEEYIFPTLVGRALNERGGAPWTVINSGVGGWGTLQQLTYAKDHLAEFRPDVVVLTFCDNDLQDDVIFSRGKATGLLPGFPGKQWLRDHSRLYPLIYARLSPMLFHDALQGEESRKPAPAAEAPREAGTPVDQSNPGGPDLIVAWAQYWPRTLDAIREFHALLLRQNPRALLVVQQAQPLRADIFAMLRQLDNGGSLRYVHLGLDVEQWPDRNVLLPYDPHWHPAMHRLAAARLLDVVGAWEHEGVP